MAQNSRWADRIALAIAVIGIIATGFIADRVYERIPHLEDEFALLWQAEVIAEGDLYRPSPEHERSFLIPFVVDFEGRRFGKYAPGWPATLSLGARMDAAGWVNPLLSGAALWFTYRLARKLLNPGLSLLAELLLLSSPMFLMLSGTLMSHMLSLLLAIAFMLAWWDLFLYGGSDAEIPRGLLVSVAGASIGLLFLTRPLTAVAIAFPFGIHAVLLLVHTSRREGAALFGLAVLGAALAALLLLWNWALTGDALTNPYTLWWPYDRIGFGPGIGVTQSGHSLYWAYYNTRFSLQAGLHDLFGWPYLSWILIPFGLIALSRRAGMWLLGSVFISLVLAYGFYWIGSWLFGPRYYFEALPGLAIVSAGGFGWLGGWTTGSSGALRVRRLVSLAVVTGLLLINVVFYLPRRVGGMQGLYGIDRQSASPFEVSQPDQSLIIIRAPRWFHYARYLYQVEPFSDSQLLIAWSRGDEIDGRLMRSYPHRAIYYYDVENDVIELVPPR